MKRPLLLLPLLLLLLQTTLSYSQTTLAIGDIAFTGYNSDGTDEFSFIILRTGGIANGTQIRFTNYGWSAGACGTNGWGSTAEEDILWTASGVAAYGTQIRITGLTASSGSVSGVAAMNLSSGGDQLFAIQGARTGVHTMIAGIHMNEEPGITAASNWDNAGVPSGTQSNRPACLTNGTYALFINPEVDNARLKTTVVLTNNPATDRATINNAANWDTDDATAFTLPPGLITLPVKFTYVSIAEQGMTVKLQWGIAEEQNIELYVVEQSLDGNHFIDAGNLQATGRSAYEWAEPIPAATRYYRVRAEELSGKKIYTPVIRFSGKNNNAALQVSAAGGILLLRANRLPENKYTMAIYNSTGQLLHRSGVTISGSFTNYSLPLPAVQRKGSYILLLQSGTDQFTARFLVD